MLNMASGRDTMISRESLGMAMESRPKRRCVPVPEMGIKRKEEGKPHDLRQG